jgi:hypothetical protein
MASNSFNCFLISFDNKSLFCGSNFVGVGCGVVVLLVGEDTPPDFSLVDEVSEDSPKDTEIFENIKIITITNKNPIMTDSLISISNLDYFNV